MEKEKYLIVTSMNETYFYPYVTNKNIDIVPPYNKMNKIQNFVMKSKRRLGFDFSEFLFLKNIHEDYAGIVVFDCACDMRNMRLMRKKHENVNLYIWNIMKDFMGRLKLTNPNVNAEYIKSCFNHVYSFDKGDCEKYGIEYFPPLYTRDLKLNKEVYEYDLVFLGSEKGRYDILKTIYDELNENGFKQYFHVFSKNADADVKDGFALTSLKMTYDDYLKLVSKSRAILDIPQDGQIGCTIRVMESLFLHKKLITTCKEIMNYSIYNKNNIFIVGIDDYSRMKEFLNSDYDISADKYLDYYDIPEWSKYICGHKKPNDKDII